VCEAQARRRGEWVANLNLSVSPCAHLPICPLPTARCPITRTITQRPQREPQRRAGAACAERSELELELVIRCVWRDLENGEERLCVRLPRFPGAGTILADSANLARCTALRNACEQLLSLHQCDSGDGTLLLFVSEAPTELRVVPLTARGLVRCFPPASRPLPRRSAPSRRGSESVSATAQPQTTPCEHPARTTAGHPLTLELGAACVCSGQPQKPNRRPIASSRPLSPSRARPPALVIPALLSGIGRRGGDCGQRTSGAEWAGATRGCATALTRRPRRLPLLCAEGAATAATERGHGRRSQQQPRASQSSIHDGSRSAPT